MCFHSFFMGKALPYCIEKISRQDYAAAERKKSNSPIPDGRNERAFHFCRQAPCYLSPFVARTVSFTVYSTVVLTAAFNHDKFDDGFRKCGDTPTWKIRLKLPKLGA